MPFTFQNLDATTRHYMLQEVDLDIAAGNLYISPRLNEQGISAYPLLLREALAWHDETWLAEQLQGYMKPTETRQIDADEVMVRKVPYNAHETLAASEFNRFYMRGLCARAIAEDISTVEVYRGKPVKRPRAESQNRIGQKLPVQTLLDELRNTVGADASIGFPAGPNSGLTIRLAE